MIFVISFVTSLVGYAISNMEFFATWDRFLLQELSENMTFKWHLLERNLHRKRKRLREHYAWELRRVI